MATNMNDGDDVMDLDDDKLLEETIQDKVTKESFLSMVESTSGSGDFQKIINLLLNSSQQYGHSLTMNAIFKIICRHSVFKDQCTGFYTTKMTSGKETKVVSTYNSNKELL
jgi:hypothetical protein